MEKRVLLAVVLSFVVLYTFQALFLPPPVEQQAAAPPATVEPVPQSSRQAPEAAPGPQATPPLEQAQPLVGADSEQEVVVESDAVRAVFSTRGGTLLSWKLKRYNDAEGQQLDLVPHAVPGAIRPFTLQTDDPAASALLNGALFKPSTRSISVGDTPAALTFEYRDAGGVSARKEFMFRADEPYTVRFTADVRRNDQTLNPAVAWGPALGTGIVGGGMNYNPPPQPIFYKDRKVTRVKVGDIAQHRSVEGTFGFVGVDDHYFLSAAIPSAQPLQVQYEPVLVPVEGSEKGLQFISWSARYPEAPKEVEYFLGPKDFDVLASVNRDLVRAIDFGMFSWLVVPLLRALKWLNGYIHNYGWSIIALTVLINLVMFPLRHKSVVSMRKMQDLQPEVKAIQERYSKLKINDPARQKMNVELMNLYRERGVNPASGCVPMLLTFPVLLAFYAMLSVAIELRGAPFVGWIRDLSAHDPYFVTPILMGITMVVQQKMTPSTADPMQQKMMMFMPIIFTFMFVWAPSGLVLYWTVSNLWAIGQQALTNRLIGPAAQHAVRPPAERRLKNAGGGKSIQAAKERK